MQSDGGHMINAGELRKQLIKLAEEFALLDIGTKVMINGKPGTIQDISKEEKLYLIKMDESNDIIKVPVGEDASGKRYVVLTKVSTPEEADKVAREFGFATDEAFKEEAGSSLAGYWVDTDYIMFEPDVAKERTDHEINLGPIAVLVHGRLFAESAKGFLSKDGKKAFVPESEYDEIT